MRRYRVALLGCRARGTSQASAIARHPRTDLVGICDLLPQRLAELGNRFGVPEAARYTDFEQRKGSSAHRRRYASATRATTVATGSSTRAAMPWR